MERGRDVRLLNLPTGFARVGIYVLSVNYSYLIGASSTENGNRSKNGENLTDQKFTVNDLIKKVQI